MCKLCLLASILLFAACQSKPFFLSAKDKISKVTKERSVKQQQPLINSYFGETLDKFANHYKTETKS